MTTQQQQAEELTPQQLDVLNAMSKQLSEKQLLEAVRQIIDEHQGPFEFSGRPEYLVARNDVPIGMWDALAELRRMHLSSGPKQFSRSGDTVEGQQEVLAHQTQATLGLI